MSKVGEFVNCHRASAGLLVAASLLAPACAVDAPTATGDAPIAELALAGGVTVSFYEPRPGALAVSETAPAGVQPPPHSRAVELYASLAPGRPVPDALLAAQARSDAARAERPRPLENVGAPTTLSLTFIDNKTIDDRWFVDNHCDGAFDKIQCRINNTDSTSSYEPDMDYVVYWTCVDVGKVTQRTRIDDDPFHSWDLFEGDCHYYWYDSGTFNDAAYGDVVNVGGSDRYHFSARYNF